MEKLNNLLGILSVNGIVACSLCVALLICVFNGNLELSQSLVSGLLGFLSRSVIKA